MLDRPRLIIAGLSGGAGKTMVSLGLARALAGRGLTVRPFKKGDLVAGLLGNMPATLAEVAVMDISSRDGVKFILADDSWLLIRPSGTEPVLRIYAEGRSEDQVQALLRLGGELAEAQIALLEGERI